MMFRLLLIFVLFLCDCGEKELPVETNLLLAMTEEKATGATKEINLGSGSYRLKLSGSDHAMKIFFNNHQIFDIWTGAGVIRLSCIYPDNSYRSFLYPNQFIVQTNELGEASIGCESGIGQVKLNGNQVLGPQQPAIEDASGQADIERKLNLLLEACREHGLIARGGTELAHEQSR